MPGSKTAANPRRSSSPAANQQPDSEPAAIVAAWLLFRGCPAESGSYILAIWADSDHAGELSDARSTTGCAILAQAPRTWCLLDWFCKRQGASSSSTTEAEIVASHQGVFRGGMPLLGILDFLHARTVRFVLFQDNSACVCDVRKGFSRKLAHLARHQRVSLAALHEQLVEGGHGDIVQVATKKQLADLLTKGLPHDVHWVLSFQLGLWARPADA